MKVLMITNDPTILDQGSSGHAHVRENALAIGELHVLIDGSDDIVRDEESLRVRSVKRGKLSPYRCLTDTARSLIQEQGIQALWSQDPFELGVVTSQLAREFNLPFYVNVHTDFLSPWYLKSGMFRSSKVKIPPQHRMRTTLAGKVLPQAAGIRVMSERVKESLVKKYGSAIRTPVVIPVQVSTAPIEKVAFPVPGFPFNLITAGRIDPGRRVIDIIDALALVAGTYPGLGLFIIGDGPERIRLERHVRARKLSDRVVFLGERPDTQGLICSANVYVQASAYEGYGRRLLQAALARTPIITTDVGIVGEVFKGYDDVLAMPPADPSALAVHIVGLMEDVQARNLLAMNAESSARRFLAEAGDIPTRLAVFLGKKETMLPV